ncbi:hypothetical protein [Candidatus Protochlamydia phocaeensis]|uniref:hypothetical protein n=1 Tax=Candidatus Protochlamydia phocaeensis TaxID=1414722 RepID=UPI0008387D06|nr:hypothetical protein [Candidatus Protochlamydia phocaeensis]
MNTIRNGLGTVSSAFLDYAYTTQQSLNSIVLKLKDLRNNTEIFQKVCQVAFAIIQYANWYRNTAVLSRFSFILSTANLHDFYSIIKKPRGWFFPITADRINANKLLDALEAKLVTVFGIAPDSENALGLRSVIYKHLKAQLESMGSNDDAYRNTQELLVVLQRRMQRAGTERVLIEREGENPIEVTYDLSTIDILDVPVEFNSIPLAERLTNWTWDAVDVGCFFLYMNPQGWNLIDTPKLANQIGQFRVFGWVRNQGLETWVRAGVCLAYSLKLFEAVRKLSDEKLTSKLKAKAKWDAINSVAEIVFQGAGYLNHIGKTNFSVGFLSVACIVAKTIGIYAIVRRPRPNYFEAAAAA